MCIRDRSWSPAPVPHIPQRRKRTLNLWRYRSAVPRLYSLSPGCPFLFFVSFLKFVILFILLLQSTLLYYTAFICKLQHFIRTFVLFAFVFFLWYFFVLSISAPCLSFPLRKEILLPHICGCKLSKWHPIILLLHPDCCAYKKRASAYWQKPRLSVPFADLPETHLICFSNI